MKERIGQFLFLLGRAVVALANALRLSKSNKLWFRDHGNETLRLDYDGLNQDSLVLDLGGYRGQWASDIFAKYLSNIHVFEPIPVYADLIERRFKKNDKIHVHRFGLSNRSAVIPITVKEDASSHIRAARGLPVQVIDIVDCLKELEIEEVDLIKINIEGAEYDLLDRLLEANLIRRFKNIQIQFHDFVNNASERMRAIQEHLAKTHSLTYQYRFVFENWKRL